ncbi:MAG: phosphoenolpyruvate carboxykinase (GTP) [Myxococcales bacterium]|nr:phosphoenolpyruvate carboxykinase (GTP) [Myxococcales bacterium]
MPQEPSAPTQNPTLLAWVREVAAHTQPDRIVWCDGSQEEADRVTAEMLADGTLIALNAEKNPNSYLHRSHKSDVARTEHLTFICTETALACGPTNNWKSPADARKDVWPWFEGAMRGRTMYVVPYIMGPTTSPYSRPGVEITDSAYVVANMRIMTRMGKVALERIGDSADFVRGLHSLGDLSPDRRAICHFPQDRLIWSVGSGYGGNALLGKKCHALRIASAQGRDEGWMAEHMLILGLESPEGDITYMGAAFPSACGKTNLAMMVAPLTQQGWRVWTVGDDIAWMHIGEDGQLWAVNPEAGFFGVAPGTSLRTNPNAIRTIEKNAIFTNVALADDNSVWWEGLGDPPAHLVDWKGDDWTPASTAPAAHPNSRFTVAAAQCPQASPRMEDPRGVPISAILFGGRRARVAPLVFEARSWQHGVYVGATVASETTAAATGAVGVVRRDPMAMRPFCGYNMGDYFSHWLKMGTKLTKPPKVFHVNWFRKGADGKFLWPGYGDNLRVLRWVRGRVRGEAKARETAIGFVPEHGELDLTGLEGVDVDDLLAVDNAEWRSEIAGQREFFAEFGGTVPAELSLELEGVAARLG